MTYPKVELVKYRLERAREAMDEAEVMAEMEHWKTCINRLYYSCFYAINALLIQNNLSSAKHSGVRSHFNKQFIVTEKIPKEYGRLYNLLFKYRQQSDYEDFFEIDELIVKEWIEKTKVFLNIVREEIQSKD